MTILDIVPGKPRMCLQENLVDCANCGGLIKTNHQKPRQYDDIVKYIDQKK